MSAALIHFPDKAFVNEEEFTSSGTFTVPDGVTKVLVEGVGAGGGGGGANNNALSGTSDSRGLAGNGGYSGIYGYKWVDVTPGAGVAVTIGTGGAGGAVNTSGSDGGNTQFGSVTFWGGKGGFNGTIIAAAAYPLYTRRVNSSPSAGEVINVDDRTPDLGSNKGGFGASYYDFDNSIDPGTDGPDALNQVGGTAGSDTGGGGGAASPFGAGGNGGIGGGVPAQRDGVAAGANSGAGGGGGGHREDDTTNGSGVGGAGGSGRIVVYWIDPQ